MKATKVLASAAVSLVMVMGLTACGTTNGKTTTGKGPISQGQATTPTTPGTGTKTQPVTAPTTQPGTKPAQSQPAKKEVKYTVMEAPQGNFKSLIEAIKKHRGYFYFKENKVLAILMGEQTTGGYNIRINNIYQMGDQLVVETKETIPGPNDTVTQAFTYPMVLIQLEEAPKRIKVVDDKQGKYPEIQGNFY